jgi:hypothetical protein
MSGTGGRCRSDFSLSPRLSMLYPDGAPLFPPNHPPALLYPPPGVKKGAFIWLLRAGYASTTRAVATAPSLPDWRTYGRREPPRSDAPPLAAAPASHETDSQLGRRSSCGAHGRPHSGCRRRHAAAQPLTMTVGQKSPRPNDGGNASCRRSVAGVQQQNQGSLLYPGGGTEQRPCRCVPIRGESARTRDRACSGRGDEWGADQAPHGKSDRQTGQLPAKGKGKH